MPASDEGGGERPKHPNSKDLMNILIATYPLAGHTLPLRGIVRELVERGHRVRWYAGAGFTGVVRATGAEHLRMDPAIDRDTRPLDEAHPERARLRGMQKLSWDFKHLFIDAGSGQLAGLRGALAAEPADVVVSDLGFFGARLLGELDGVRWASVGTTPLTLPGPGIPPFGPGLRPRASVLGAIRDGVLTAVTDRAMRGIVAHQDALRAELGLAASELSLMAGVISPHLHLQAGVPGMDYPRSALPATLHHVGDISPAHGDTADAPVLPADDRPVVHVTQGTAANADMGELIVPTLAALAGEDVHVVATLGSRDATFTGQVPDNAVVAPYVSYPDLLPRTSVMVTNGGYGGVTQALAHGVPLVVAGAGEDKPEVAARVAWSGAGINLRTGTPSPKRIRAAVRDVLETPTYTARARAIADELSRYGGPKLAADLIERLGSRDPARELERRPADHSR